MPRKRSRFKKLNEQLKATKGATGTTSRVTKYLDFLTGKTDFNISTDALTAIKGGGGRSGSFGVALKPFNIATPSDADTTYFASFTKYSKSVLAPLALTNECGHGTIGAKTIDDYSYNPAIIICHIRTATTSTEVTSQITGDKYKRYAGQSGTIPFGCKDAYGEKEDVRKRVIITAAKNATNSPAYTATYQPEEWNSPRIRMKQV